jgi:hypothetical protein
MEEADSTDTLVPIYQSTRHHIRKTWTDINNPNVIRSRELSVRAIHRPHGTIKARGLGTGQSIWNL